MNRKVQVSTDTKYSPRLSNSDTVDGRILTAACMSVNCRCHVMKASNIEHTPRENVLLDIFLGDKIYVKHRRSALSCKPECFVRDTCHTYSRSHVISVNTLFSYHAKNIRYRGSTGDTRAVIPVKESSDLFFLKRNHQPCAYH